MTPAAASATAGYLGLLIFIPFFVCVVVLLLRRGAKEQADAHAQIPFKENGSHD